MRLLLIGASAGSVETIEKLLLQLDTSKVITILAIHMNKAYIPGFSELLQKRTCKVVEVLHEFTPLQKGSIYVCDTKEPNIDLCHRNGALYVRYNESEYSIYRPNIDYLYRSVAASDMARKSVAILLSGIGADGAKGLKMLKEMGSLTLVAAEETAPIYGIPKAAIELGAHCKKVDVDEAIELIEGFWDAKLS